MNNNLLKQYNKSIQIILFIFSVIFAENVLANDIKVVSLVGRANAMQGNGQIRTLKVGDLVRSKDLINTGINTYITLNFSDGGRITIRPNSRFEVEEYQFTPRTESASNTSTAAPKRDSAAFRLLKGGFRAVSGLVGKLNREDYKVRTPVATIGIRGTDYIVYLCEGDCQINNQAAPNSVGVPEGSVVVGVIEGGVYVESVKGTTDLSKDEYSYTTREGVTIKLPYRPSLLFFDPIPDPDCTAG